VSHSIDDILQLRRMPARDKSKAHRAGIPRAITSYRVLLQLLLLLFVLLLLLLLPATTLVL